MAVRGDHTEQGALRHSGLPPQLRGRLEQSFSADLSFVRLHADGPSHAAARALGASAFTIGDDVHFAAGELDEESSRGQALIAHEVAHTLQFRRNGGAAGSARPAPVTLPSDPEEVEAERATDAFIRRTTFSIVEGARPGRLARQAAPSVQREATKVAAELQALINAADKPTFENTLRQASWRRERATLEEDAVKRRLAFGLASPAIQQATDQQMVPMQATWGSSTLQQNLTLITNLVNGNLGTVNVPPVTVTVAPMTGAWGQFVPGTWTLVISSAFMAKTALTNDEAGQLINLLTHESRHAEQMFYAARYAASIKGKNGLPVNTAASLVDADMRPGSDGEPRRLPRIPLNVAQLAMADPLDSSADPTARSFGNWMYHWAFTRSAAAVFAAKQQAYTDASNAREDMRNAAIKARDDLIADPSPTTLKAARKGREALRQAMATAKRTYSAERRSPNELDAYQVGEAARSVSSYPSQLGSPRAPVTGR